MAMTFRLNGLSWHKRAIQFLINQVSGRQPGFVPWLQNSADAIS
jgi:hypothetical protein